VRNRRVAKLARPVADGDMGVLNAQFADVAAAMGKKRAKKEQRTKAAVVVTTAGLGRTPQPRNAEVYPTPRNTTDPIGRAPSSAAAEKALAEARRRVMPLDTSRRYPGAFKRGGR
jgi:hypothetical protein